ncbi:dynamin family GTPase [Hokovirus HKV1]|uniref:Dynamin family GTPase n=1 Tax=Hokovirus HKV1 TaxID=1977638 RepID=A0A1V0SEK8_9VIRU|nr:dynamin family GTPase [Hokovirus HKV1]
MSVSNIINGVDKLQVNIAILGSISSGKSTLINAIFSDHYTENKIQRTTMIPQIYIEGINNKDANVIFQENKQCNDDNKIIENKLKEITHIVNKIPLINNRNNLRLSIYDLPGLNDIETKEIYYNYVKNNFYKFDIILYLIDIESALNTSDE